MADPEPDLVELPEDASERIGVLASDDELAGVAFPSNPRWMTVKQSQPGERDPDIQASRTRR